MFKNKISDTEEIDLNDPLGVKSLDETQKMLAFSLCMGYTNTRFRLR